MNPQATLSPRAITCRTSFIYKVRDLIRNPGFNKAKWIWKNAGPQHHNIRTFFFERGFTHEEVFARRCSHSFVGTSAAFAQVVVRVAPPPPIVERHPVAPGPRYVWVGGYHRWDGRRYVGCLAAGLCRLAPALSGFPDTGTPAPAAGYGLGVTGANSCL
jgi:hypothetical protein